MAKKEKVRFVVDDDRFKDRRECGFKDGRERG